MVKELIWTLCDSYSDLSARLEKSPRSVVGEIKTDGAREWGYLAIGEYVVPIGFAAIGLVPQSIAISGRIVVGINELVVGLDCDTGKTVFQYEMPTIFHDFLAADERGYLLNDETGFVCIDRNGLEKWTFLPGLIGRFEFLDGVIAGETIDGAPFQVRVPEY